MVMPGRPSTPPVMRVSLLASSKNISATPSVTIRRDRSLPRSSKKLLRKPTMPANSAASSRPSSGSLQPCEPIRPTV